MKKLSLLLLVLSFLVASPVLAEHAISTSGDYLIYCQESIKAYEGKSADVSAASFCLGFVEAAIGMHFVLTASQHAVPYYCMPENEVSSFEASLIWYKYLTNHPQKLTNAPIITFVLAMSEAFPCTESKTK